MDRRVEDLEMILDPDQWPNWPILPMKKAWSANPNMGIIFNWMSLDNVNQLRWYPGQTMFEFDPKAEHVVLDKTGVENLLDEGWKVD